MFIQSLGQGQIYNLPTWALLQEKHHKTTHSEVFYYYLEMEIQFNLSLSNNVEVKPHNSVSSELPLTPPSKS